MSKLICLCFRALLEKGHTQEHPIHNGVAQPEETPPEVVWDQEVEKDPKGALEKMSELVKGDKTDKVIAHSVVLQILAHQDIDDEGIDAAWQLVSQIDAFGSHTTVSDLLAHKPDTNEGWNSQSHLEDLYADSDSEENEESHTKEKPAFRIGLPINLMWSSPVHIRNMRDEKTVEPCFQ